MAVIVEMKEAKNAADVVIEVTHMVSNEWLRAAWTMASNCSSIEFRFGSAFEWAFQAFTRIKVSSAPTPEKTQKIFKACPSVIILILSILDTFKDFLIN